MSIVKLMPLTWPTWLQSRRRRFALIAILVVMGLVLYDRCRPARLQPHLLIKELSSDLDASTLTVCPQHGYLVEVLQGEHQESRHQVAILDAVSGRELAMLGVRDELGDDQRHLSYPEGATCDEKRGRIVVADSGNLRIQIFDIDTFAYRDTVPTPEGLSDLAMDAEGDRIFAITPYRGVSDVGGNVWVLDAATLRPTGREIGTHSRQGMPVINSTFLEPKRVTIDQAHGHLLVLDSGNDYVENRVLVFSLATLADVGSFGSSDRYGGDDPHPLYPTSVAIDDATGHILVGDQANSYVQILDGSRFTYVDAIDRRGFFMPVNIATYKGLIIIQRASGIGEEHDHVELYGPFINRHPAP